MNADLLHQKFDKALELGCNFAAIRLPETGDTLFFYATAHPAMRRVQYQPHDRPVFLCSPYSAGNKAYTLVSDAVFKNEECVFGELPSSPPLSAKAWHKGAGDSNFFADEAFYTGYINKIVEAIEKDKFDKVVAARCEPLPFNGEINAAELFTTACEKYPAACVYFFSTRDAGTWFGASPERLVAVNGNTIETIALAGTLPVDEADNWTDKEYDEQGMISFFIDNVFKNHGFKNVNQTDVETLTAGNIKHLSSRFKVKATSEFLEGKFHKLLNELNPTPAVCGLPQFEASLFIAEHEKTERRFYSGFTGVQFENGNINTYVNLRCAELYAGHALLYAGAGITAASQPEKEWNETQRKLNTIKSILEK